MSKKSKAAKVAKVAEVEVVEETNISQVIIEDVLSKLPGIEETKQKLVEYMETESDHKTAKSIIANFAQLSKDLETEISAVEHLEMQIEMYTGKDNDRANLAKQKLELVNRYYEWKKGADKLRKELDETYSTLDEVIAGLREYRGTNSKVGSGTRVRQACIISLASDEGTVVGEYPSLNNAVDNLIDKSERSQVFLKDGKGKSAPFKYDSEGNMIPVLDKDGNPTYYTMRAEASIAALEKKGFVVTIK